jgi:hypothetical protein
MTITAPEAFPIVWHEPSDADVTWEWDDMHTPRPLTPLGEDYVGLLRRGFAYKYERLGVPAQVLVRVWNGYAYFGFRINVPEDERAAAMDRYTEIRRRLVPLTTAYWRDEGLPSLRAMYREIDDVDVDGLPAGQLADAWEMAWTHAEHAWGIHFYVITGPYQVLEDLADRYEALVENSSPGEAFALVAGLADDLRLVEEGLERLTLTGAAAPAVASLLRSGGATIADVEAVDGSAPFMAELRTFLAEHGHLGQSREDLGEASWLEDAGPLLADIGKRFAAPVPPVAERWAARAAESAAMEARVRRLLANRPDEQAEFEALLAAAREVGPLTEGHNYWIDRMCADCLRRFAFRVARRLVREGRLAAADDILFVTRREVPAILAGDLDPRPLTIERRREHARRAALQPPRIVASRSPIPATRTDSTGRGSSPIPMGRCGEPARLRVSSGVAPASSSGRRISDGSCGATSSSPPRRTRAGCRSSRSRPGS